MALLAGSVQAAMRDITPRNSVRSVCVDAVLAATSTSSSPRRVPSSPSEMPRRALSA
eukprot:CAMPEP_0180027652 /NCGR_PEP_ID=MMETSP0984-20121128/25862_1 /TAXON_ID=483367 /ORGANISM="non described non described, Strain CCMP 2436" /LENGTH=56 /DNA_ID=CAMNT_0021952483 /DNA_START=1 /DNA_END=167 /DNA_ORIENTATION=-